MLAILIVAFVPKVGASATHLLEEPYGKLGFFSATGHSAVYLSGVCAESPLILVGALWDKWALSSAANGVGGYDWIAIPLVRYLCAVEHLEDVPLFAETTAEQDEALILKYNWSQNRSHFRTISRNCADFVKDVINFYQPTALHRSYA